MSNKAALFIDAENLFYSTQNQYQCQPDFDLILKLASQHGAVVQANAYADFRRLPQDATLALFLCGVRLVHAPGWANGGQDPKNSTDQVLAADLRDVLEKDHTISTYILASGDGHFVPTVTAVRRRGKRAMVLAIPKTSSSLLIRAAHLFIPYIPEAAGQEEGRQEDNLLARRTA